jgi:hypothetical protein
MLHYEEDVLLIEDSSEFEWNQLEPIEGLGPIGSGREGDQGFILHSTLAVGITSKEALRGYLDAPAEQSGLDELEIKVLRAYLEREIKTVKCVALAIGKLGGHLNSRP